MNIGKKIKELRTEKLMTQSELAGAEITRNMLSRIENEAALPSLGTVMYLAERLGVPAGYLLSEGDEEFTYRKTGAMKNIKKAYADRRYELCYDLCNESFDEFDDEIELIMSDACLGISEEHMRNGALHEACSYLDQALRHTEKTVYNTVSQKNSARVLFGLLKEISPSLDSYEIDTDKDISFVSPSTLDSIFCKYVSVLLDASKYESFASEYTEETADNLSEFDRPYAYHIFARKHMQNKDFKSALMLLDKVMESKIGSQKLLLYFACADMEICCRETDDYKGAYEFAQNKMEILEHMLAEI